MAPRQLHSIQVLRGLAALAVVIGHLWQIEVRFLGEELTSSVMLIGFAGVDMFFVLSGFVMVHVTRGMETDTRSNAHFLYKRVTRIYPPYWVFTILMIAAILIAPDTNTERLNAPAIVDSFLLLPQFDVPILPVGWTLVHEMYFYIVFTGLLFLPRRWLPFALLAWLLAVAVGTGYGLHRLTATFSIIFNPLTLEFLLGAALALWQPKLPQWAGGLAVAIGASALLAAAYAMGPLSVETFPALWTRFFVFGLPVFLIVLGMLSFETDKPAGLYAALVRLGDWSYSLYLGHLIFLAAGARLWVMIVPDIGWVDNLAMLSLGVAGCILAAGLSYHWIERPMLVATRRFGHRIFRS
ncbi:acyltransferase family protein [Hyphobacterium sp.]|uniref:acyltransferase family protein n=1 Tax=Hyphobacterium sp. TaxID=2004662 RepID=UPI003BACF803